MPRVVIGIHFGVSETKVSWLVHEDQDIEHPLTYINNWPCTPLGFMNRGRSMVPSRIHYGPNGDVTWGYNIPADAQPVKCLPLLILPRIDAPTDREYCSDYDSAYRRCLELGKHPHQAISDYLWHIYDHACKQIESELTAEEFSTMQIHVVLTSLAGWNCDATKGLRMIAEKSGMTQYHPVGKRVVTVLPEPAAITLATFCGPSSLGDIEKNDVFTILSVDAATTKIITYKVFDVPANGMHLGVVSHKVEFSGPSILHDRFKALVKEKVGEKRFDTLSAEGMDELMSSWNKKIIAPEADGPGAAWVLRVETSPRGCNRTITHDELLGIYNSVVPQIRSLIVAHIQEVHRNTNTISKCLIIAGDVFTNRYILGAIMNTWQSLGPHANNTIIKAGGLNPDGDEPFPWLAVSRCAAVCGMLQFLAGHDGVVCSPNEGPNHQFHY